MLLTYNLGYLDGQIWYPHFIEYIKTYTYKFSVNAMHPKSSSEIQIYVRYKMHV